MMHAAENGHVSCMELLIEFGADKDAKDDVSNSSLIPVVILCLSCVL